MWISEQNSKDSDPLRHGQMTRKIGIKFDIWVRNIAFSFSLTEKLVKFFFYVAKGFIIYMVPAGAPVQRFDIAFTLTWNMAQHDKNTQILSKTTCVGNGSRNTREIQNGKIWSTWISMLPCLDHHPLSKIMFKGTYIKIILYLIWGWKSFWHATSKLEV